MHVERSNAHCKPPSYSIATDDGGVSEFTAATAAAADDEGKSEQAKREGTGDEAKQKEEEGMDVELSPETVSVHVEAVVAALELLLYSEVGEVAKVKVKGQHFQKNGFVTWYNINSLAEHAVQYACSYVYN